MAVSLIYTGGTIGCAGSPLTALSGEDFVRRFDGEVRPHLPSRYRETRIDYPPRTLDSTGMGPADWVRLMGRITRSTADRIVVLHGTDTMAWTAAALRFLACSYNAQGQVTGHLGKRIALTGSQVPMFPSGPIDPASDGLSNLQQALDWASDGPPDCAICFGGETIEAARGIKRSASDFRAFEMPNGPGSMVDPGPGETIAPLPGFGAKQVLPLIASPGADLAAILGAMLERGTELPAALHLLGFGVGNMPDATRLTPVLKAAQARGILMAIGTQTGHGRVTPDNYGVGHWLADCGVMPAGDMTIAATQVKLHMTTALRDLHGWDTQICRSFFTRNVVGELS